MIRVVGQPRRDDGGGNLLFVGAVTDITDAKRAAEALRESEERFRTMADTLQESIWIRGLAPERILYVSPSFERIWGLPPEVVITSRISGPRRSTRRTSIGSSTLFRRWIAGETSLPRHRVPHHPPGWRRPLVPRPRRLRRDEHGQPIRASGISADITDRKRAEEDLQRALREIQTLKDRLYEGERRAARGNRQGVDVRGDRRRLAGAAGGARPRRQGRADGLDGAHHRRDRHRQGARRPRHPQALAARRPARS